MSELYLWLADGLRPVTYPIRLSLSIKAMASAARKKLESNANFIVG